MQPDLFLLLLLLLLFLCTVPSRWNKDEMLACWGNVNLTDLLNLDWIKAPLTHIRT